MSPLQLKLYALDTRISAVGRLLNAGGLCAWARTYWSCIADKLQVTRNNAVLDCAAEWERLK